MADVDVDGGRGRRRRQAVSQQPLHHCAMPVLGVEQLNRFVGDDDAGAGPKHPGQWGLRRQAVLQTEAKSAEFEGDPAEGLFGFQEQPVDRLAKHRCGPAGPGLSLRDTVAGDAQLVAVQLDHRQDTEGEHPLAVLLVEQVFLAVAFGQQRGQLSGQIRGGDYRRHGKRQ